MKVIHFHFGKEGGAERFFAHLVNALARRGIEQTSFIRANRSWRRDIENVATIVESDFRHISLDRILLPIKAIRMARSQKPDALFSWAQRGSRLMPNHKGCIKLSRLGDYPTSLRHFDNIDVLVCNTPGIGDHVRELGWTRGVEVISNFTDTECVAPVDRAILNTPEGAPIVMSMGRFVPRKGFATLITAIAKLPGVYLWLAGDGKERENISKIVDDLGVADRVRLLGWQKDIRPFLAAADIFVMPSSHEPLGNVILEAWAQRKPVVSSRTEGPSWFMRDGENGLFAEIDDVDSFARAIERLLNDSVLASNIAAGGHETLMTEFSEESVANAYIELFKKKPGDYA